jgi:hypothetical protein
MSELNKLKVVDFTAGRLSSDDINTNIPFRDNLAKTRTIQQANAVIGAYVNRNYTDMQNKADKDEIPTKVSELENDEGYITTGDIPSKTSDLINDGENGVNPFITNQVNDLTNYTNNTNLTTLLNNKASTTDLNNVKSAIDYKSTKYMGNVVVESIRSKNMFDKNALVYGFYASNGTFTPGSTSNAVFNYIPVESNKTYIFNVTANCQNVTLVEFNSSKTFIQRNILYSNKTISITTTSTTKYIRCQFNYNNAAITESTLETLKPQFEEGSTATNYMPFQNLDGMETYSNGETLIGTFLGKPLYRKVLEYTTTQTIGDINATTNYNFPHNISNLKEVTDFKLHTTDNTLFPRAYYANNKMSWSGLISADNTNVVFRIINDTWSAKTWHITLEYTKTTD